MMRSNLVVHLDPRKDNGITARDRDTMEQVRMPIDQLIAYIDGKLEF